MPCQAAGPAAVPHTSAVPQGDGQQDRGPSLCPSLAPVRPRPRPWGSSAGAPGGCVVLAARTGCEMGVPLHGHIMQDTLWGCRTGGLDPPQPLLGRHRCRRLPGMLPTAVVPVPWGRVWARGTRSPNADPEAQAGAGGGTARGRRRRPCSGAGGARRVPCRSPRVPLSPRRFDRCRLPPGERLRAEAPGLPGRAFDGEINELRSTWALVAAELRVAATARRRCRGAPGPPSPLGAPPAPLLPRFPQAACSGGTPGPRGLVPAGFSLTRPHSF